MTKDKKKEKTLPKRPVTLNNLVPDSADRDLFTFKIIKENPPKIILGNNEERVAQGVLYRLVEIDDFGTVKMVLAESPSKLQIEQMLHLVKTYIDFTVKALSN